MEKGGEKGRRNGNCIHSNGFVLAMVVVGDEMKLLVLKSPAVLQI